MPVKQKTWVTSPCYHVPMLPMILGRVCTRNCGFCAVPHGHPLAPDPAVEGRVCSSAAHVLRLPPDPAEPQAVAEAAYRLALTHVVITSVTRDDLADGGAGHFVRTIRAVRRRLPRAAIEVLTSHSGGDPAAIETALQARPDLFNHNPETVQGLYPTIRPTYPGRATIAPLVSPSGAGGAPPRRSVRRLLSRRQVLARLRVEWSRPMNSPSPREMPISSGASRRRAGGMRA